MEHLLGMRACERIFVGESGNPRRPAGPDGRYHHRHGSRCHLRGQPAPNACASVEPLISPRPLHAHGPGQCTSSQGVCCLTLETGAPPRWIGLHDGLSRDCGRAHAVITIHSIAHKWHHSLGSRGLGLACRSAGSARENAKAQTLQRARPCACICYPGRSRPTRMFECV